MPSPLHSSGLLLALDSFVVCLALGTLPQPPLRRCWLVVSFALCDGLASWLGAASGAASYLLLAGAEWLGPAAVAAYGLYVLALACRARWSAGSWAERWLVLGLPLCLSIDNAASLGAASGGMALLGLVAGTAVARWAPTRAAWLGGSLLLAVAAVLCCLETLS
jgi:putative Mn2+ efflux pump MntP